MFFIIVLEIHTGTTWAGFQLPGDSESLVIKKYKFSKSASKGFLAVHNPKRNPGYVGPHATSTIGPLHSPARGFTP